MENNEKKQPIEKSDPEDMTAEDLETFMMNAAGNTLEELANKMEAAEQREDAQVARGFILALPHELSLESNREICENFVNLMVEKHGVAAHVAIHKPDELRKSETHRSNDSLKNIHAHITVSTRAIDENGNFPGGKLRKMNDRKYLVELKTQTRTIINEILERDGFDSMEMRDPNKIGTQHLGLELTRIERRGKIPKQTHDPNEKVLKSFNRCKEHQDVVPKQEKEAQGVSIGV